MAAFAASRNAPLTLRPFSVRDVQGVAVLLHGLAEVSERLPEGDLLLARADDAVQALQGVGQLLGLGSLVLQLSRRSGEPASPARLRVPGQLRLGVDVCSASAYRAAACEELLLRRAVASASFGEPVEGLRRHVRGAALHEALEGVVHGLDLVAGLVQGDGDSIEPLGG
jgi:hypothetical protein